MTQRTLSAEHVLRDSLLHQRALGGGECVQHMPFRAGKGALVAGLHLAPECLARLFWGEPGVNRYDRLLIGEENPVTILFRQVAPWAVDVIAERGQYVALVLALPRCRPRRDGSLANGKRIIRHHGALRHFIDPAESIALRTRSLRRVSGKGFCVEERLAGRIISRP